MHKEDILKRVIKLFSTMTEAEEINEDSELLEDLGISSMDTLFLISSLEEEFQVKVSEKAIRNIVTVGEAAEVISGLLK